LFRIDEGYLSHRQHDRHLFHQQSETRRGGRQLCRPNEPDHAVPVAGWVKHAETYEYDADGRVLRQYGYGRPL